MPVWNHSPGCFADTNSAGCHWNSNASFRAVCHLKSDGGTFDAKLEESLMADEEHGQSGPRHTTMLGNFREFTEMKHNSHIIRGRHKSAGTIVDS